MKTVPFKVITKKQSPWGNTFKSFKKPETQISKVNMAQQEYVIISLKNGAILKSTRYLTDDPFYYFLAKDSSAFLKNTNMAFVPVFLTIPSWLCSKTMILATPLSLPSLYLMRFSFFYYLKVLKLLSLFWRCNKFLLATSVLHSHFRHITTHSFNENWFGVTCF